MRRCWGLIVRRMHVHGVIVKLTSGGSCGDRDIGKCVDIICMVVGWRADSFLALDLTRNQM